MVRARPKADIPEKLAGTLIGVMQPSAMIGVILPSHT